MTNPEAVEALVERLGELLAKATPGPWAAAVEPESYPESDDKDFPAVVRGSNVEIAYLRERYDTNLVQVNDVDAALIVEAVNALPTLLAALSSAPVAASKVKTETPASPADLLAHLRRIPMTEWVWQDAEMIFATLEAAALSHASPVDEGGFRSAVFGAVHQLLPAAHDARSTRFRASVQVEVARILEEARAAMLAASTPKDTGERG